MLFYAYFPFTKPLNKFVCLRINIEGPHKYHISKKFYKFCMSEFRFRKQIYAVVSDPVLIGLHLLHCFL